jgi:cytochrome c553
MKRFLALFAGAALAVSAGSAFAAEAAAKKDVAKADPAKGQVIATQVCVACHGADGNSVAPVNPKIAGQFPEYLHKQLTNFKPQGAKKAERENPIMAGMVANLSPDDMKNLAAYFAGQKLKPATAKDSKLASAGQKLWRGGNLATGVAACAGCHGPDGAGIPAQYPRIAGQYAEYIEAQLKAFQAGQRANDPGGMMRGVAARMTEGEMKAVAEYAAGLR